MKYIHSQETLEIPEGVKVAIKTRVVTVEGPRGKLVKDLSHIAVNFGQPSSPRRDLRDTLNQLPD